MLTVRTTLILIAVLFADSAVAQSQVPPPIIGERSHQQKQSKNPEKDATSNQYGSEQSPVFIKVLPAQESEAKAAKDAEERNQKAELDRKLVEFNGDLAYYTKVLAIVAGLQFLALIGQIIFMRLAFKESKRAANIARDAMVAGERAFVFAIALSQYWEEVPGTTQFNWRFRPNWRNSGDTPTKNMTMHVACELRETELPTGFDFDYATDAIFPGLIPPNTTLEGGQVPPPAILPAITPQDLIDMGAGRKFFYIWGWARYFDVFPGTPQHITRFCWLVVFAGNPLAFRPRSTILGETLTFNYIYHQEGNCADDECL